MSEGGCTGYQDLPPPTAAYQDLPRTYRAGCPAFMGLRRGQQARQLHDHGQCDHCGTGSTKAADKVEDKVLGRGGATNGYRCLPMVTAPYLECWHGVKTLTVRIALDQPTGSTHRVWFLAKRRHGSEGGGPYPQKKRQSVRILYFIRFRALFSVRKNVRSRQPNVRGWFVGHEFARCCGRRPALRREPLAVPVFA